MNIQNLSKSEKKRISFYYRLAMSVKDFKYAKRSAEHLILQQEIYDENLGNGDYLPKYAFYTSLIVSYCRPFNSYGKSNIGKIPPLDVKELSFLNEKGQENHNYLMTCRNKLIAHTDAEVVDLDPFVATDLPGNNVVLNGNGGTLSPFTKKYTKEILCHIEDVHAWSAQTLYDREKEVKKHFSVGEYLDE